MEKISDRIYNIIKNEGITIRAFEQKIGCSNGLISKFLKNGQSSDVEKHTDINGRWLSIIIETFPQYNSRWLLTGHGKMTGSETDTEITTRNNEPLYSISEFMTLVEKKDEVILELAKEIGRLENQVNNFKRPGSYGTLDRVAEP